ncbi:hypothetical protein ABK040_014435 [Willaertia magna]
MSSTGLNELDQIKLRYNEWQPEFVKNSISNEIFTWKREIHFGFSKALDILNNNDESETSWVPIVLSTIRLFNRYIISVDYPLDLKDRKNLLETCLELLIHEKLDKYVEIKTKLANTLLIILKDKYEILLSEQDSIKPITCWKRLYHMIKNYYFTKQRTLLYSPSSSYGKTLVKLICKLRTFFPPSATSEILEEFTSKMYFSDSEFFVSQGFLCLFLPTNHPFKYNNNQEDNKKVGFWLEEMLAIWEWNCDSAYYDLNFVSLFYRLAKEQAGKVNWKPHLNYIFSRNLRSMDLPVGSASNTPISGALSSKIVRNVLSSGTTNAASGIINALNRSTSTYHSFPTQSCSVFWKLSDSKNLLQQYNAQLIIWLLSPEVPEVMQLLRTLFQSIEQYLHPSNHGDWSFHLSIFLSVLCRTLAKRLKLERNSDSHIPKNYQLTDEMITEFIEIIYPIIKMALFSKSMKVSKNAIQAFKHLCFIKPSLIIERIFEIVFYSLETLTEVHQISVALELLNTVILPLMSKVEELPILKDYMKDLLHLGLQGIDSNDQTKTSLTFSFFNTLFAVFPLIPANDYNEEVPFVTQCYHDFVFEFLRKVLQVLGEMSPPEKKDKKKKKETMHLSKSLSLFFQQLSPDLHKACVKKLIEYLLSEFKPNASKAIGDLAHFAACYLDESGKSEIYDPLGMIVDALLTKLRAKNRNQLHHLTETESAYYFRILSKTVKNNANVILHTDKLIDLLRLTWPSTSKGIVKSSGKLIRNILQSLTHTYLMEKRNVAPDVWFSSNFQKEHYKYWGKLTNLENVKPQWHVPTEKELTVAAQIYNEFILDGISTITDVSKNLQESQLITVTKEELINAIIKIKYLMKGSSLMLEEMKENELPEFTKKVVNNFTNENAGIKTIPNDQLKVTRSGVSKALHELLHKALQIGLPKEEETEDVKMSTGKSIIDIRVLITLTKAIHVTLCFRMFKFSKMQGLSKAWKTMKLHFFKSCNSKQEYPRCIMLDRIHMLFIARVFLRTIPFTSIHMDLLNDLKVLATNSEYSKVRSKAQNTFVSVLKLFNQKIFEEFVPQVIDILSNKESTHPQINGAIYLLEKSSIVRRVMDNWNLSSKILPALCSCYHVDKSSIQRRLHNLYVVYSISFKELPIPNEESRNYFNELVSKLLSVAINLSQSLYWNYHLMTLSCLSLFVRSDRKILFPLEAAKHFATNLTSDHVGLRLLSAKTLSLILTQYKPIQPRYITEDKEEIKQILSHPNSPPTTQEEFEKSKYLDKNLLGWNGIPPHLKVYDYTKERIFSDSTLDLINTLKPIVTNEQWLKSVFNYFSEENAGNNSKFSKTITQLFKGMFQIFGSEILEILKPHIDNLLTCSGSGTSEESAKLCLVSEILGGLARGFKHWKFHERQLATEYFLSKLSYLIDTCSSQCIDSFRLALHYAVFDLDGRRTKYLVDFFSSKIDLDYGTSNSQAKALQLAFFVLIEHDWRDNQVIEQIIEEKLFNHIFSSYQQVREMIAKIMSLLFLKKWRPSRDENGTPVLCKAQSSLFSELLKVQQSFSNNNLNIINSDDNTFNIPTFVFQAFQTYQFINRDEFIEKKFLPKLYEQLQQLLKENRERLSEQSMIISDTQQKHHKLSKEEIALKTFTRTVIEFLANSLMFGVNVILPYLPSILTIILQIFTSSHDTEVATQSAAVVSRISGFLFPEYIITDLLSIIMFLQQQLMQNQSSSTSWRIRLALCVFIQRFGYRHQFYLLDDCRDTFYDHLLTLLKDKSVEVKDAAVNTLSGFIKIAPDTTVNKILDIFSKQVDELFEIKKNGNAEQLQQLDAHFVVLGLGAIIRAFPYTLPPFIPKVLVMLTKFNNYQKSKGENANVQVIREFVKSTFSLFHKTHLDQWEEEHKKKFNEEELYIVSQLLYSPVYYA